MNDTMLHCSATTGQTLLLQLSVQKVLSFQFHNEPIGAKRHLNHTYKL